MTLTYVFPPSPRHLRVLRRSVRQGLEEEGVVRDVVDDVVLVLDELVSNAIEHSVAYRDRDGNLAVNLRVQGGQVLLEFEDPDVPAETVRVLAQALRCSREHRPPSHGERGRGLYLIATRIDRAVVATRPGGGLRLSGRFSGAHG